MADITLTDITLTDITLTDITLSVLDNGPIIVKGDFFVANGAINPYLKQQHIAICRCGASANKSFCDGVHAKAGFEASDRAPTN